MAALNMFTIQAMVQNAMEHSLPLALSFIDLKNAFGSILHAYLKDMLKLIKLPREFTDYVSSLYSSISAHVFTKHWKTKHFSITKGVFQGDTLSPLLFLIAINPIIQSVALYPASRGFALKPPIQSELEEQPLPQLNSYVYVLWDEKNSDEATGWYLAKVQSVDDHGECTLQYRRGKLIEMANLKNIKWKLAKGNGKWYLPCSSDPPLTVTAPTVYSTPHKVKGYADDLTVISTSPVELQETVNLVEVRCKDVCLNIRPDKCYSLVYDGKAATRFPCITASGGSITSIVEKSTTFLGSIVACNSKSRKKVANCAFSTILTTHLQGLDRAPVRGEYKVWMYRRYVIPSLHYELSVNGTTVSISRKLNLLATRYLKKWLGLCRSTTVAVIHHPAVLNIPTLENWSTSAKISYLAAVAVSPDPMIQEIAGIALSNQFALAYGITDTTRAALSTAIKSVESINRKTLARSAHALHAEVREEKWDLSLGKLKVQGKFKDACSLEKENRIWNRIMDGLPPGQLSFVLRAASDTLPTPLNLCRWKYRTDPKCSLCGSNFPTVRHVLNSCPTSLEQGRFTWRHDSVLQKLVSAILPTLSEGEKVYADLLNLRACDNSSATIPEKIITTSARPDLVLVREKEVVLMELTIPHNSLEAMNNAQRRKKSKENYQLVLYK